MEGIENSIAASKETAELGLKDIDKSIDTEHYYNKEKFQEIMSCVKNMKKGEMEEERAKTEGSEEEEEEELPGARGHDMN
eukprot:353728-Heterocapsa_arctica.AAC.1